MSDVVSKPPPARPRQSWGRPLWITVGLLLLAALSLELRSSWGQARLFAAIGRRLSFDVEPGPSPSIRFPSSGPYDRRLGYARMPEFLERLAPDYRIEAQARTSAWMSRLLERGFYPAYREKLTAGLRVEDRLGRAMFAARYPERVYEDFSQVPPRIVQTLLFIENRELLDTRYPYRNPAVEWDRLARAMFESGVQVFGSDRRGPGGSTLATQLEKLRHSTEGRTFGAGDKLRQMLSASLRAYREGEDTSDARRNIVVEYLNSLPLAAAAEHGEVQGLGDGLYVWYGSDFEAVNHLLEPPEDGTDRPIGSAEALAYKQVLSLLIAQRRPTSFLLRDPARLAEVTDTYLRLVADERIVTDELRDMALQLPLQFRRPASRAARAPAFEHKAALAVRARLAQRLGLEHLYELDRLDLSVRTTFDAAVQSEVTRLLRRLQEPQGAVEAGLLRAGLLATGDPREVAYSFTLYERGPRRNLLRVQADTLDAPLNLNEGVKLELGSTAKLRTLVTYLEIVSALHAQYAGELRHRLKHVEVAEGDRITRWGLDYLTQADDRSLGAMLEAAMQRLYSASPDETFYTGGGQHRFVNFDSDFDDQVVNVREAFEHSVNLPFIRLMRDVVHYEMFRVPGSSAQMLEDVNDPRRQDYLARFADREGRQFLAAFWREHRGRSPEEMVEALLSRGRQTPRRAAVVLRSVRPAAGLEEFAELLRAALPDSNLGEGTVAELYAENDPERLDLADRGYLARIHPLELWLVEYLGGQPRATLDEAVEASGAERQQVYRWLFRTRHKTAQDLRIKTLLEVEAFLEIHRSWQRTGYPFGSLVPSYATAIGSSADRPGALAELVGIVLADGVRQPTEPVEELRFAERTPYETQLALSEAPGERVMQPEVAAVVRDSLLRVVREGTARRASDALLLADGSNAPVGGKTGTGDNRYEVFGPGGRVLESRAINRTATFVFLVGDRFYGTMTAYVPGPQAGDYRFTSALAVEAFRYLGPALEPLLRDAAPPVPPEAAATTAQVAG